MNKIFSGKLPQVLFYLGLLVVIDNFFLQGLQSPDALLKWAASLVDDPNLRLEYFETGSIINGFPGWADSLIWVILTVVLWAINRKRFLLLPLFLYTIWITFWVIVGVILLAINLWNPNSGADILLSDAFFLWVSIITVFAIWYWVLDHDNQQVHKINKNQKVHFMFPQKSDTIPGGNEWIPSFLDYLFFSFNTTTSFGVTDTLVISKKAKVLIMIQSLLSLILFVLIISRAINIIQ